MAGNPLDVLGDPNRRTILRLLSSRSRSVQELADELPISRPAVSRHLRLLKDAGLVVEEPHGTRNIYRLDPTGSESIRAYFVEVWGEIATRFTIAAENT